MTTLNKAAAEEITAVRVGAPSIQPERRSEERQPTASEPTPVHALTDITGFGLIGHAREIALASNVSLRLHAGRIALIEGALECASAGNIPGGLKANREFAECAVGYEGEIREEIKSSLFDPQTAGGLLVSVAADDATELARALGRAGVTATEIGEVGPESKPLIRVVGN